MQAHLTMNASFEFETFRQDELFWMNTFFGGDMVLIVCFFFFGDVFWHNYMTCFKVAHEVDKAHPHANENHQNCS